MPYGNILKCLNEISSILDQGKTVIVAETVAKLLL